jgi:chorismate mutase
LHELRRLIDGVDGQLLDLLVERFEIAEDVASHKLKAGLEPRIAARIRHVINDREKRGRRLGLPARSARQIWTSIVEETCRYEEALFRRGSLAPDSSRKKTRRPRAQAAP